MERGLANSLSERFSCAESAPICQGALFELLGYSADTETAEEILEGTFIPPRDTDPATIIMLGEIARVWSKMGTGEVNITVSIEDFQYYWRRIKERISSSYSKLHFGHYKSAAHSVYLSDCHAAKLSLTTKTGCTPE